MSSVELRILSMSTETEFGLNISVGWKKGVSVMCQKYPFMAANNQFNLFFQK